LTKGLNFIGCESHVTGCLLAQAQEVSLHPSCALAALCPSALFKWG